VNYDEADGSFDHILPPTPPQGPGYGASTVSTENEIVTATGQPAGFLIGPIGLNCRVPFLAISPWSKGGYVNSQVFDHTSTIQFIEKRFGVFEPNISPWRRAVCGDLTSLFNFANPNEAPVPLPNTDGFLPPTNELAGGNTTTFNPTLSDVAVGVPGQEQGIRLARALPYQLNVQAAVSNGSITLTFFNIGNATVVFQVRSGNPADLVRTYTVDPGMQLSDSWSFTSSYNLSVYGPNGFIRYFNGSNGPGAAVLDVVSLYQTQDGGFIAWQITNLASTAAAVSVLNAYTRATEMSQLLGPGQTMYSKLALLKFFGWYDLIVTVSGDPTFNYRLAGHVETGQDTISDPALGGFVTVTA
jgi:phospholipase C